jgi:hypothetical protein
MFEETDNFDVEVVQPLRAATITLEISVLEVELAVASDGASLRRRIMEALFVALALDDGTVSVRLGDDRERGIRH